MAARNRTLIVPSGLCVVCLSAGFQLAEAIRLWLEDGGVVRLPAWKTRSERLKGGAMLVFAIGIFVAITRPERREEPRRRARSP